MYAGIDEKTGNMQKETCKRPVTIHQLLTHTSGLNYEIQAEHNPVAKLYQQSSADRAPLSLE